MTLHAINRSSVRFAEGHSKGTTLTWVPEWKVTCKQGSFEVTRLAK